MSNEKEQSEGTSKDDYKKPLPGEPCETREIAVFVSFSRCRACKPSSGSSVSINLTRLVDAHPVTLNLAYDDEMVAILTKTISTRIHCLREFVCALVESLYLVFARAVLLQCQTQGSSRRSGSRLRVVRNRDSVCSPGQAQRLSRISDATLHQLKEQKTSER